MTTSRDVLASSPDICRGQISWDYDRAEIIADGVVHAIGVCLGLIGSVTGAFLRPPHRLPGDPGCGPWLRGITRTERPRMDMRQHVTPPCRHSRGAGTERRDRRCALSPKWVSAPPRPAQRAPQVGFEVDDQFIFGRFPNRAPL